MAALTLGKGIGRDQPSESFAFAVLSPKKDGGRGMNFIGLTHHIKAGGLSPCFRISMTTSRGLPS